MLLEANRSGLLVVDLQPKFMAPMPNSAKVLQRAAFLIQCAQLLNVPIFASEQNQSRMGSTEIGIAELLSKASARMEGKMIFSALGCTSCLDWIRSHGRDQIIVIGIESHICVTQTALQLKSHGLDVFVAEDAVCARTDEMHRIAMNRLRQENVRLVHSEQAVYEWMGSAEHPMFKQVLQVVKESS